MRRLRDSDFLSLKMADSETRQLRSSRTLVLLAAVIAGLSCGDSGGPSTSGPSFFTVSVNGAPWYPDTSVGILFGVTPDSGTLDLVAARRIPGQDQTITLAIRDFPRLGTRALSDITGTATGVVTIYYTADSTLPPPTTTYFSTPQLPGTLRLTALDQTDSTVVGSFAFTGITTPDTAPHLSLSGSFRLRYTFQQVYPPAPR